MSGALNFFCYWHSSHFQLATFADLILELWCGILASMNSTSSNTTAFPYQEPQSSLGTWMPIFRLPHFREPLWTQCFWNHHSTAQAAWSYWQRQHSHMKEYAGSTCNNKCSLRGTRQCQQIAWYFGTILFNYMSLWQLHLNSCISKNFYEINSPDNILRCKSERGRGKVEFIKLFIVLICSAYQVFLK